MKIRASRIAGIMTEPKLKSEAGKLSQTAKSYIEELYIFNTFGRSKDTDNKYTQKGVAVEPASIELYNSVCGKNVMKNILGYQNEFITGTPDIVTDSRVIDIKSSWSIHTFPFFDDKAGDKYYWQMQGYMWLTGHEVADVVYCLVDTPEDIISDEARKLAYRGFMIEEALDIVKSEMTYSDIPADHRVKVFHVFRNQEDINKIAEKVELCREYYNSLEKKIEAIKRINNRRQ